MQTNFISKKFTYDGSQLQPLYAYMNHGILGNSVISWVGPCDISFANMKDGEDLLEKSEIRGSNMLHFIIEIFQKDLFSGVVCQRLFASIVHQYLEKKALKALKGELLTREGDDIYWGEKKLSISIASCSPVSTQIHFAVNISTKNTPVKTTSLEELKLDPKKVAEDLMALWKEEFISMHMATQKVKPLS
jgi:uncharacterized protein